MLKSNLSYTKNLANHNSSEKNSSASASHFFFNTEQNPYHLVNPSPWPIAVSFSLLGLVTSFVLSFANAKLWGIQLCISIFSLLVCVYSWFSDVLAESKAEGAHAPKVQFNLETSIYFFIASEVLFFFGFFWGYFHSGIISTSWVGEVWPPQQLKALDPLGLPFFNTILLLSSGLSVTYAHRALFAENCKSDVLVGLGATIFYGLLFTILQVIEYNACNFSAVDTSFGTVFFLLTGFHGLHVLIGTLMLSVVFIRVWRDEINETHHIGFEAAILYWHFVDIVWLFLFVFIYVVVIGGGY